MRYDLERYLIPAEKAGGVSVTFYCVNIPPQGRLRMVGHVEHGHNPSRVPFDTIDELHLILRKLADPSVDE